MFTPYGHPDRTGPAREIHSTFTCEREQPALAYSL